MKKNIVVTIFLLASCVAFSQDEKIKKSDNLLMIGMQPTLFRLNYFDPEFFNNPELKPGIDFTFHYGKTFLNSWVAKTGGDITLNSGKYILGTFNDKKYINESFLRIPFGLVKKFPVDCNDCFMSPSVFVEAGGYLSFSLYQSTYIQDAPTGLSSLDNRTGLGYMKGGYSIGLGLSFLSNNFGRHVLGVRFYSDQFAKEFKTTEFKPSYSSMAVFYNVANISW
jgi:hypothetical protein